jgi:hypothetical protein
LRSNPKMKNLFFTLASFVALVPAALSQCFPDTMNFSPITSIGTPQVQFTSCPSQADGPRIDKLGLSTFDWWYFDAVSTDGSQAFTVIFFTSSAIGFSFDFFSAVDPLNVWVFASFGDGSPASVFPVPAVSVTTTTNGDGASGDWHGSGISFKGEPDLSSYVVKLDNPVIGLTGTFTLKSVRAPCFIFRPIPANIDLFSVALDITTVALWDLTKTNNHCLTSAGLMLCQVLMQWWMLKFLANP